MFKHRPAMKIFVPLAMGIIAGWHWQVHLVPFLWLPILAGLLISAALLFRPSSLTRDIFLLLAIFLLGMTKIVHDVGYGSRNLISNYLGTKDSVRLTGSIVNKAAVTPSTIRVTIEAESLQIGEARHPASGGVLVSFRKNLSDTTLIDSLTYGRRISCCGELAPVGRKRNPGDFDAEAYYKLNDVYARLYVNGLEEQQLGYRPAFSFVGSLVAPFQASCNQRLETLIGGEEGEFLKGLVVGERSEISPELKQAFINAGVMHILAVSGLHVAIVVLIILLILEILRIPEKPRILIACLLLVYYNYLTGGTASVSRSVIMAMVFLGAKLFERRSDMYNTLAVSAIILVLIDAKQLFQAGFQLSYVAVFSLIYLYPKIYAMRKRLPEQFRELFIVKAFIAAVAVSIAAGIGTLPFTSFYFGRISIVGFLANVIIVPLSNIVLSLGMLTIGLSYLSPWVASVYGVATRVLTQILLWFVNYFGNLSFSYVASHFTILTSVIFYGMVGACIQLTKPGSRKYVILGGLLILNVWIVSSIFFPQEEEKLQVTVLDVGQGDAIFLRFPDETAMLIDAGPRGFSLDAGKRFILPFLRSENIKGLLTVLVTHPHSDHIGGLPYLLRNLTMGEVIYSGNDTSSALCQESTYLIDSLARRHRCIAIGEQLDITPNARLYVLHPDPRFIHPSFKNRSSLNNQSIVVKLVYGTTSVLLVGDAERTVEASMIKHYGKFLQSDILKVGHHGSITSTSMEFLKSVRPQWAAISVGERNKFHHPSPMVLQRLAASGCTVSRTDQEGAIIFESDGSTWKYVDWR